MTKDLPLTKTTIVTQHPNVNWYTIDDLQLNHLLDFEEFQKASIKNKLPFIGIVETEKGESVSGRFFPAVKSLNYAPCILVYKHSDDLVTLATIIHELAHYKSYICECNHIPIKKSHIIKCQYKGEHDKEFYERLEPMYRASMIPTYAARAVEGKYSYPSHWKKDEWT